MKPLSTVLIVLSSLFLCSCVQENDINTSVNENMSEYQIEALADGEITREEYDQGFQNYRSCMESIGFPLIDLEEVDLKYNFSYSSEANERGGDDCYSREFSEIDMKWSMRPEVLELTPDSAIVRECLLERGIEPADNHAARVDQALDLGIDIINECYQ